MHHTLLFQVFSEMDFLGWYSTGDAPTEADIHVHKQVSQTNQNPGKDLFGCSSQNTLTSS
jgi:JAB1/Mov34/MPN/PAD-1 ubiquitin protease